MQDSAGQLHEPGPDNARIRDSLADGQRLVACLCAAWCSSCTAWRQAFAELAAEFSGDCFVWIDIEDQSDLVADIEVETLPVLFVQTTSGIEFVGPIEPRASFLRALLQRMQATQADPEMPDLRNIFLSGSFAESDRGFHQPPKE